MNSEMRYDAEFSNSFGCARGFGALMTKSLPSLTGGFGLKSYHHHFSSAQFRLRGGGNHK